MTQAGDSIAIIIGGLGAALSLINLILLAALWSNLMATTTAGQAALAKIAALSTAVSALSASGHGPDESAADLAEVNASLDTLGSTVPGYVAPEPAPAPDPNA